MSEPVNQWPQTLDERIDRLESLDAIRQLAGKYSLSLDMRDMDAHVNLFAPDIKVGKDKVGVRISWPGRTARCVTSSRAPRTIWASTSSSLWTGSRHRRGLLQERA
jgi:hypothetical protein